MSDTLEAWMAEEAALHARQREHGQPQDGGLGSAEQFAGLTGLAQLQLMIDGKVSVPPIAHTLDFWLLRAEHGQAVFQGKPLFKHFNPLGTVHGGWFATVLDSALGCAVHSTMAIGEGYTTAELKLNLVRALKPGSPGAPERVRAISRIRHRGRQMASAEADLVGPDGKLYAHASTTCLVFTAK